MSEFRKRPVGRPASPPEKRHTVRFSLWLTQEEYVAIEQCARENGTSMAALMRDGALGLCEEKRDARA